MHVKLDSQIKPNILRNQTVYTHEIFLNFFTVYKGPSHSIANVEEWPWNSGKNDSLPSPYNEQSEKNKQSVQTAIQ